MNQRRLGSGGFGLGAALSVLSALLLVHCGSSSDPAAPTPVPIPPPPSTTPVLVGAGDIGDCTHSDIVATAKLLDGISGTVFTTGDNVYDGPTAEHYANCYGPTWGRQLLRTRPTLGNHDYDPPGTWTYYEYFGAAAGDPGVGYYSYDLGGWHILALDSNQSLRAGSAQLAWVEGDVLAHAAPCTLAYWHHPLFTSGNHNDGQVFIRDLWRVLYKYGVDVVLNGHEHFYERFAPQDPDGNADPAKGIRQFTAGTGGAPLYGFSTPLKTSESRGTVHGVLKITLQGNAYLWEFIPVAGQTFRDGGAGTCH